MTSTWSYTTILLDDVNSDSNTNIIITQLRHSSSKTSQHLTTRPTRLVHLNTSTHRTWTGLLQPIRGDQVVACNQSMMVVPGCVRPLDTARCRQCQGVACSFSDPLNVPAATGEIDNAANFTPGICTQRRPMQSRLGVWINGRIVLVRDDN